MSEVKIDSFCFNCEYTFSKHRAIYLGSYIEYNCPCDDTGVEFYHSVTFVPMTNLEYLERKYQDRNG